jgi:outer membrane translocation and assembly module TamA
LFNHDIDGFASAFVEHTERPSFVANRIDFSLQILKRFTPQENFLFSTGYQTVNLQDPRVNLQFKNLPSERGVIQIARVGTSFIQDRRDDPLNPSTGTFNTTTFQVAARAIGSEINFTSLYDQYSFYTPVRFGVFVSSIRFGWNHPFGKTAILPPGKTEALPPTERYFAGGSTTLRGFGFDKAKPGGGNVMTIGNFEYRVPLRNFPISGVGGALFYDTGNVFNRVAEIQVKNFTHTAGFGLRYQTPVGPVRLDFGINLKRHVNGLNEKRLHVFFTLGNPF